MLSVLTKWHRGEPIRIAFLAQFPAGWSGWRSVVAYASNDPRFDVRVYVLPNHQPTYTPTDIERAQAQLTALLRDEGVEPQLGSADALRSFRPHVVFVQTPYENTRPADFSLASLIGGGARPVYIPYSLEVGGGAWNRKAQYDLALQRSAWRIYARSVTQQEMFQRACRVGAAHVEVTGHPRFDTLTTGAAPTAPDALVRKAQGRRVLLWTPHFSVGEERVWSTYQQNGAALLDAASQHEDTLLLVRPHPHFFATMRARGVWTSHDEQAFRQRLERSPGLYLDESADYRMAFAASHALLADAGSFLLEYLPTGKPVVYLELPGGWGLSEEGERIAAVLYRARTPAEATAWMRRLANEEDPRRAERLAALPQLLFGLGTQIGQRICDHIAWALHEEEAGFRVPLSLVPPYRRIVGALQQLAARRREPGRDKR